MLAASVERAEPEGADVDALVDGMTRFGVDMYREVLPTGEAGGTNVVLSPASIAIAFGMARAGARGTTADQIDEVLHFPADPAITHASFNALDRALAKAAPAELAAEEPDASRPTGETSPPALAIANGVFPDVGFAIKEDYLATLAAQYGAGVTPIDYDNPERAKEILDAWVLDRTRGRIEELFDKVSPNTVLVLANAVYLKADWLHPFMESTTEDQPFMLADGSRAEVPTMQQLGRLRHAQGEGWQAVELPYVGERLAMRVLVPTGDGDPADVLDPAVLTAVEEGLTEKVVDLRLPRWDYDTDVGLIPVLKALGMQAPFDSVAADFSGIADSGLWIGDAIHRATITVDEWGTEAAGHGAGLR